MYAMDIVKQIAEQQGIPITRVGVEMGKSRQYVHGLMQHGSTPRCDTMARMLDVCGYALVAVPRDSVPSDALVIDGGEG